MRPYSPGGLLIALAAAQQDWVPATPSNHRLGLGLPGYLILFAPLAFAPQRQLWSSAPLSPQVFLPISTHFTATPGIPRTSPILQHHSFACRLQVKPGDFTSDLWHPTRPLRPIIPNNARTLCITAAAGTELAGASSTSTVIIVLVERSLRPMGFILHAALLRQGFPHCAKFPTAASRRSLDRVSVPVCPCALSGRIPIFALVGRYPAN